MATSELARLLTAAGGGDRQAFRGVYDATAAHLFGLALRILRRRDAAEETLQEAFVSIWQHAGDYQPERGAPLAWMATIVRHRALDRLRRERATVPLDDVPEREAWPDPGPAPPRSPPASTNWRPTRARL